MPAVNSLKLIYNINISKLIGPSKLSFSSFKHAGVISSITIGNTALIVSYLLLKLIQYPLIKSSLTKGYYYLI